jgi:ABC-type transport system involved in multi-copper enzyme maturation permease subunit
LSWREQLAKVDAVQKGRLFKVIASIVLAVAMIAAAITYVVVTNKPIDATEALPQALAESGAENQTTIDATKRVVEAVLAGRQDSTSVLVGMGVGLALGLAVIWLGLGLTYLALIVCGLMPAVAIGLWTSWNSFAWLMGGVVLLTASFSALLRGMRVLYSMPSRTFAIAKNVLDEATRLKISQVFIVALIVGLALLPLTIGASDQLRYRVQTFLSFGMGGSFWLIATLVVLFSVATVCFEQRDRVIWQTMTKPVAPWQYIFGKWLGVSGLAAILLAVAGSGIYLFTEHLRAQPAYGERADQAYTVEGGGLSKDRRILETQILSARKTIQPEGLEFDEAKLQKSIEEIASSEIDLKGDLIVDAQQRAMFEGSKEARFAAIRKELTQAYQSAYRSVEPGASEIYVFKGLEAARKSSQLILLRYKIDTGNNAPNEQYKVTFDFGNGMLETKDVILGQVQILELLPDAVDKDGTIQFAVHNGDPRREIVNPKTFSFPPDGLEISYAVSTFAANFARVLFVLWVKLAFLAMLGICAATFLSFPVACLVAFGAFLSAESALYLRSSLDSFATTSVDGKEIYYVRTVMAAISMGVSWLFSTYSELDPSRRAVEGVLMSWGEVAKGLIVLTAWSGTLFAGATAIFRRRELATYSGH